MAMAVSLSPEGRGRELRPPFRQFSARVGALPALAAPAAAPRLEIDVAAAEPALAEQHRHLSRDVRQPELPRAHQHMPQPRRERQPRDRLAVRCRASIRIERVERRQPRPRLLHRSLGRRVEPAQLPRIRHAPQPAIERQRRQIGLEDLGRVETREPRSRGFLPQPVSGARPLAGGAARALRHRRLARALGDEPRHPSRTIVAWTPREPRIDHDRYAVERQAGLGDRRRQHDLAPPRSIGRDRGALRGGVEAAVQAMQDDAFAEPVEPLGGALDLGDAGEEGEDPAALLAQGEPHRSGDRVLDPRLGGTAEMAQRQRVHPPRALDHRRAVHQLREARAVERRRHCHQSQIRAQTRLRVERERQPEIAVEAAFMDLVEQHRRDARQFGIVLDARDKDPLGHHGNPRRARPLRIHPRGIAIGLADRLAGGRRHAFGGRTRGKTARREEQYLAAAPRLVEQGRRDRRGLARAGRRDEHGVAGVAQGREQTGQDGEDRERRAVGRRSGGRNGGDHDALCCARSRCARTA